MNAFMFELLSHKILQGLKENPKSSRAPKNHASKVPNGS